nr:hypothetical protein [Tanacetum cinerariifolium]
MTESPLVDSSLVVLVFSPGDDPISYLNESMAFLTAIASSRSRVQNDQAIQTIIPNNVAFQTADLDTYNFDCDDISNAKAVLMANISNYGSDIISEVPHSETYLNDMENQRKDPEAIKQNISHKPIDYVKLNQLSENFRKRFTLLQELLAEQAFWFCISNPTIESSNKPDVKVKVPSKLPKVSLMNASLKKLKFHLAQFDSVVKKRTTPNART